MKNFQVKAAGNNIDGIVEMQDVNIAVSDYNKNCVKVYTATGQCVQQFDVKGGPSGLAVNGRGQLFVADYEGHRVSVFNQNGRYQYSFGSKGGALASSQTLSRSALHLMDWSISLTGEITVYRCLSKMAHLYGKSAKPCSNARQV